MERVRICDRCEAAIAVLECTLCHQSDGITRLALCQSCSDVIHVGKARDHRVITIELKNVDAMIAEIIDFEKQREDLSCYRKQVCDTMEGLNQGFVVNRNELHTQFEKLKDKVIAVEQRLLKGLEDMHREKNMYLKGIKESCDTDLSLMAHLLTSSMRALSSDSFSKKDRENLAEQLLDHKKKVQSLLTSPLYNPSCGFCPSFGPVNGALDSIITYYPWDLPCGQQYDITEVGSLQSNGVFTALLSSNSDTQNVLDHISLAITAQLEGSLPGSCPPLKHPLVPGQLCCAKYKEDHRWHRARVEKSTLDLTQVMFLDYGNVEEVDPSELHSLDEKFLAYPFRVLDCHITEDTSEVSERREVRWKFKDLVAERKLSVKLVKRLSMSAFLVQLLDVTNEEPFDIGVSVLAYAQTLADNKPLEHTSRDIRCKNQAPKPQSDGHTSRFDVAAQVEGSEMKAKSSVGDRLATVGHTSKGHVSQDLNVQNISSGLPPEPLNTEVKCFPEPLIDHLHSALHVGAHLIVVVNSDIDRDGTFWVQAEPSDKQYRDMQQEIQNETVAPSICTSVHQGEYYLALYSEDMQWYRACVESVDRDKYGVRYIDYGNYAVLRVNQLAELKPQFRVLPPQAFKCTILSDKHPLLSEKEFELLEPLVADREIPVEILQINKDVVYLTIFVESSGKDILEVILSDVGTGDDQDIQEEWTLGSHYRPKEKSWADEMERLEQNLAPSGHTSDLSDDQRIKEEDAFHKVWNRAREPLSAPIHGPDRSDDSNRTEVGKEISTRPRRINKDAARKSILSNLKQTGQQRPRNAHKMTSPPTANSSLPTPSPPPKTAFLPNLPVKLRVTNLCEKSMEDVVAMFRTFGPVGEDVSYDQKTMLITMEAAGAKAAVDSLSSSVLRIEIISGSASGSPDPNSMDDTCKLLVQDFPIDFSRESLIGLFAKYGTVRNLSFQLEDRSAAVVTMDVCGAQQALSNLHKINIGGKNMVVERYQVGFHEL